MGRFLTGLFIVLVAIVLFAVSGDLFPEGSALRNMADGLREIAGEMFGGGYGAVSPG